MLGEKLQLKDGYGVHLINSPFKHDQLFGDNQGVLPALGQSTPTDSVLLFIMSQSELDALAGDALKRLGSEGLLWVCYPKKSSSIKTDVNRDHGWDPLLNAGFGPVRQISIDDTWSALRWRPEKDIKRKPDSTFKKK